MTLTVKVTTNVAQCPLYHVTYAPTELEVTTSKALGGKAFTRKFNLWPWPWGQGHMKFAQYPLHHVTYPATKFEVATSNPLGGDTFTRIYIIWSFTLTFKVTQNVAQYPLHHVTYSATKFEVATFKGLGGDAFTRKFNIWPLTLTLGSRSHEMLPSTLYIMWPIQLQSLKFLRLFV